MVLGFRIAGYTMNAIQIKNRKDQVIFVADCGV